MSGLSTRLYCSRAERKMRMKRSKAFLKWLTGSFFGKRFLILTVFSSKVSKGENIWPSLELCCGKGAYDGFESLGVWRRMFCRNWSYNWIISWLRTIGQNVCMLVLSYLKYRVIGTLSWIIWKWITSWWYKAKIQGSRKWVLDGVKFIFFRSFVNTEEPGWSF